jgi:hypothetical protein
MMATLCRIGKVCFDTRREAEENAQNVSRLVGVHVRTYLCQFCDSWHLTKQQRNTVSGDSRRRERERLAKEGDG